jgi:hypothetical protein
MTLVQLYRRAVKTGRYKGLGHEAEDFAGWLTIEYLEGKRRHQTIEQSLVDYLRATRKEYKRKKVEGKLK